MVLPKPWARSNGSFYSGFKVLLHDLCRTPEAVGVLIGALGFIIRLLWGLPGAAAFLCYRMPHASAK